MRTITISHDVTLTRCQNETPAVAQLGNKIAVDHVYDVPALAPVIREVAGRVLDDPYAHVPNLPRSPVRDPVLPRMLRGGDAPPVDRLEWCALDLHDGVETTVE